MQGSLQSHINWIEMRPLTISEILLSRAKKTQADDKWMTPVTMQENVLPLAKTLALQNERNAAIALRDLQPGVKVTLHYDSATR